MCPTLAPKLRRYSQTERVASLLPNSTDGAPFKLYHTDIGDGGDDRMTRERWIQKWYTALTEREYDTRMNMVVCTGIEGMMAHDVVKSILKLPMIHPGKIAMSRRKRNMLSDNTNRH